MLIAYQGSEALSEFRLLPLLEQCRGKVPRLTGLRAIHFYLARPTRPLAPAEEERLAAILAARGSLALGGPLQVLVCPRPGTISPWSSKATDILRHCGVEAVSRVERGVCYQFAGDRLSRDELRPVFPLLHDRMTEAVVTDPEVLFQEVAPRPLERLPLKARGRAALEEANRSLGLALSAEEIDYFVRVFAELDRDPTDVELMMFAVVNSEHCRHKIFNARWTIDGAPQERTLFEMIRHTHAVHPEGCVKAYEDNAGIIEGFRSQVFRPAGPDFRYEYQDKLAHILIKVETHNHPTAISPYPGASTGVGGEIRDEGAAGIGGQSQAGLTAFFTSHLRLPGFLQPWERAFAEFPSRLATPLAIMTEGPLGGAGFGNEFGRPNLCGLFRTTEELAAGRYRGYHKPIMVAGGVGLIDAEHVEKQPPRPGDYVVQIGGPALLIGLGGGTASSMEAGSSEEDLDYASVQRDNPEMQRRCQELINRCLALGAANPILSIHDLGAGGLSNGCPELVHEVGARFELRAVHNDDPGMSPMQLWCNEAQERYVLVIGRDDLPAFAALAERERCLYAVIGEVTGDGLLTLHDDLFDNAPIDRLDLRVILGRPPRMQREVTRQRTLPAPLDLAGVSPAEAVDRVLRFPAVAAKTFLITIADRTVTGLVARDQMVGPYQVPISDVALTAHSFRGHHGSAVAMGERTPLALIDAPASGRMAVAEAITNITAAGIGPIGRIKLSGNWMCACGEEGEDAALYDTVRAVGLEFCPALGVSIPVGKDSLSMRAVWQDCQGQDHRIVAPLSLVISAFAPVADVRRVATPDLKPVPDTCLLLVDLGHGRNRLGGSALAQVYSQIGDQGPDVDPTEVRRFYEAVQECLARGMILAYHDRSDGGLFVTLAEMAFGGRIGLDVEVGGLGAEILGTLFCEEIGAVLQVRQADEPAARAVLADAGLAAAMHRLGQPNDTGRVRLTRKGTELLDLPVTTLHRAWAELTWRMQARRDNPECARQEYESIADADDPGMTFRVAHRVLPTVAGRPRPRVAILREQGVNGQVEMAAAFDAAGCESVDVTMTDLLSGRAVLGDFRGLVACGGFSYGDVLGAGAGWARTILFHDRLRQEFAAFFARPETFSLGVCNGCQMLSHLKELIPGAAHWPRFRRNRSEQFEARYVTVEVLESPSVLLRGMAGSRLPIPCAHGEGRVEFASPADEEQVRVGSQACLRFVDNQGAPTERYPLNPNGSPGGLTGLTSLDGRTTIVMPHPERVFRNLQLSWRPADWTGEESPWLRLFQNAADFARGG
ncbi:MAG: phosphoribosylformylglycinamidine synthase [Candidatus Latescibacterota bacterium]|jgi:phosphoribosylformylglycinamidine synthase